MIVQLLLLVAVAALLVLFVRNRHGVRVAAGKRVALVLFALVNVYAVIRPDDLTALAQAIGVGRGTDLVLYALVVGFLSVTLNQYLRFQGVDARVTELARTLAVREAEIVNRDRGLLVGPDARAVPVVPGVPDEPGA
ncbi:DUF2304 domain-containing protein [Pseudonocardia sp. KRD-169]|jgi:hypothetical protein|uniref:DUF2304 domain-containing protein n=2 Tax=Pseudonocardia abyssalis TaxID=2792008 RepID=A0ABS6UY22_9PSEU|nr:DUF2304 domain-containing protein [Pseudonocardia abyssalis]MBW0137124.1 DUF2304 domain-containing protein [Pseudonocardia abyssalis]